MRSEWNECECICMWMLGDHDFLFGIVILPVYFRGNVRLETSLALDCTRCENNNKKGAPNLTVLSLSVAVKEDGSGLV